ncbi:hypothetical protein CANARDRAFT_28232 [[Candida] arabinofermentans NRRL YB-2248]|uniref:ML-like domain-containing protein n=1 Tax=[Candida] arabinofermentans NRRL YB-2248 TaxID=983967 RepID=A0A1E4T0Y2_9ASCO|nr:hypothetical protein CANARDRAFT_28232 [[Candida] arabinofermentans NRRL YB-2248]
MHLKNLILLVFQIFLFQTTVHSRVLEASSLVTCMEDSQIDPTYFSVEFDPDTKSIRYDLSLTTEIDGYIYADVLVYAYGFQIIERTVDPCSIGWKQFCPMYPGSMEVDSIQYISQSYVNMLPGISYTFPDLDALVRLNVRNANGTKVACIQASFSNGKTVSHTAVKWVTAVIAGIGLLASAILSAFGNSSSASRISANSVALFIYFQSTVIIGMIHVQECPPIVTAWIENLAWSMGLIRVEFMQEIFRWYVQATGGTPTQYITSSAVSVLVQRSINLGKKAINNFVPFYPILTWLYPSLELQISNNNNNNDLEIEKRTVDLYNLSGDEYLRILRGVERVGYQADIEPTSIVCTGFTFFIICLYVLVGLFFVFKTGLAMANKYKWLKKPIDLSRSWKFVLKGILQRYIYIGFTQLMILSLWEFTKVDSAAVVVLAVLFLLLSLGIMAWVCYKTLKFGSVSIQTHNNAAAILYGDPTVLNRYGFFYTMYNAKKYWWGAIYLTFIFVKSLFVSLAQKSGKTQALVIFILDLCYTGYLIKEMPYLDKPTNIVNILMCVVMTLNSFFFLFFSNLFGQPAAVGSIMGLIFFVLNAVFSLVLLILIIAYTLIALLSKNPDARFSPAKDDRTSFQKKGQDQMTQVPEGAQELFELGAVAKDHQNNWAGEMYKLKDMVDSSNSPSTLKNDQDEPLKLTTEEEQSFGTKLMHKLTGGKSLLRRNKSSAARSTLGVNETSNSISIENSNGNDEGINKGLSIDDHNDTIPIKHEFIQPGQHQRTESSTPIIQTTTTTANNNPFGDDQLQSSSSVHAKINSLGIESDDNLSLYQDDPTQVAGVYRDTNESNNRYSYL